MRYRYPASFEVREWAKSWLEHERRNAPITERNSVGQGMTLGAIETLERLIAWLDGDEEAGPR